MHFHGAKEGTWARVGNSTASFETLIHKTLQNNLLALFLINGFLDDFVYQEIANPLGKPLILAIYFRLR